jgi:hypothetical protein
MILGLTTIGSLAPVREFDPGAFEVSIDPGVSAPLGDRPSGGDQYGAAGRRPERRDRRGQSLRLMIRANQAARLTPL